MRIIERHHIHRVLLATFCASLALISQPTFATAGAPAAKVKQLKAAIKGTKLIAKEIRLTLELGHLYRSHKSYDAAFGVYRKLGNKYKKKEVQCVTMHFMAQTRIAQKKTSAAVSTYNAMRKLFGNKGCSCRYLPNAYIALGRVAFDQGKYNKAARLYKRAPRCRENRVAAIAAAYMRGWCTYKLKRYPQALRSMLRALRQLRKQRKRFRGTQKQMMEQIQRDAFPNLVRAFNRAGKPSSALRTFRQVAEQAQVDKMTKQLSDSYHTTKSYKKLLALYQQLAKAHRRSPKLVRDQLEILRAMYRLGKDRGQMRALKTLARTIAKYQPKANGNKALKADIADAQDQLHRFAMGKHREAQRGNDNKLYRQSEAFFTAYRTLFPKAKDAHKKAYWHGEALLTLERFARAAEAYLASARATQTFRHKEDAAYKAALARHRLLNNKQPLRYQKPKSNNAKSKPLPTKFKAFIEAASLYRKLYPSGKQVPYVTYNMGLVHQQFAQFAKARAHFAEVVQKHPRTRYARPSAYHVIDTLRIVQDWKNLHKWAKTFAAMTNFGTPLFKRQMARMGRAAQTKACFALDTAKQYAKAGDCYATMAKQLGKHKDTPILLYNAYVAYHNGKQDKRAQEMKATLLKTYPKSRPARMLKR